VRQVAQIGIRLLVGRPTRPLRVWPAGARMTSQRWLSCR
jgi:hypothetical protein